jgi:micrococcal nuclease
VPNKFPLYYLLIILLLLACRSAGELWTYVGSGQPAPGNNSSSAPEPDQSGPAPENSPSSAPKPDHGGPAQPDGLETAKVTQVVDGDTVELSDGRTVRYIGLNTPEQDQPYYNEAKEANRQLVEGKTVSLEWDVETFDQYGRNLAYVWVDGVMANWDIVWQGYANAYTVPPNVRYEAEIRAAEQEARENERGLWAGSAVTLKIIHVEADAPGSDSENPNGEWIEIANQGNAPVQMNSYTLKDEANHIYTFGDFTIPSGWSFRLYTGQGGDSSTELYWGYSGESVWNNDGDTAFLRDGEGALVDSYSY